MARRSIRIPMAVLLLLALLASARLSAPAMAQASSSSTIPAGTRPSPLAATHTRTASPTYLYTCFWKKAAVTLTPAKMRTVTKLRDAKRAGTCTGFDTADPAFKTLLGKSIKVYTAPAEYKKNLVAYQPRQGKSTAFGTWTFSAKAVIVKKTTDVLPASTVMDITPPAAGKPLNTAAPTLSLTFKASDPSVSTLKVGGVIVSGVTALTPYGMMRKITAITLGAAQVTVDTVPAQLSDVFDQATIDIHTALTQAFMRSLVRHQSPRIHVNRLRDRLSLCPTFPTLTIGSDGVQTGASKGGLGAVTLGGSLCLTAGDLQYQENVDSITPSFDWTFGGGDNLHLTYKLEGGVVAYHGDLVTLLDQKLGVIPLEEFGVPIEIVPKVTSKLTGDLNFSGYISGGVSYKGTYTAGLSCGITGCSPTGASDGGFSTDKTLSGGTASFTLSLGVGVSFLVDGVFGPGIAASIYATASAGTGIADCFSMVAGAKATLSLNFQLFGKFSWVGSWDVIKSENPVPLGLSSCVPSIKSFTADLTSPVKPGKTVTFTAVADTPVDQGGFHIRIFNAVTEETLKDCASGDTCAYQDTEKASIELVLKAQITDSGGAKLGESDPLTMNWERESPCTATASLADRLRAHQTSAPSVCLFANGQSVTTKTVGPGNTVKITAETVAELDTTRHMEITRVVKDIATGAVTTDKLTPSCHTDTTGVTDCDITESYPDERTATYTARIVDGSLALATSRPLTVNWSYKGFKFSGLSLQLKIQTRPQNCSGDGCDWDCAPGGETTCRVITVNYSEVMSGKVCGDPFAQTWTVDFANTISGSGKSGTLQSHPTADFDSTTGEVVPDPNGNGVDLRGNILGVFGLWKYVHVTMMKPPLPTQLVVTYDIGGSSVVSDGTEIRVTPSGNAATVSVVPVDDTDCTS